MCHISTVLRPFFCSVWQKKACVEEFLEFSFIFYFYPQGVLFNEIALLYMVLVIGEDSKAFFLPLPTLIFRQGRDKYFYWGFAV